MIKNCEGYPGFSVNTSGEVFKDNIPVKIRKNHGGYHMVSLRDTNNRYRQELVHRLMGFAFLGLKKNLVIDHINGIKDDNRIENLDVVTIKENNIRRYKLQGPPPRLLKRSKVT